MAVTFDGDNLLVILGVGVSEVDAKADLYSAWKGWFKTGANARYPVAFETIGGDPTTATGIVSPFFFLGNDLGWRIRPAEEDANLTILGNLYGRDPALPILAPTLGAYTVLVNIERDASSVVETVGSGVTEQDKLDIADRVLDEVMAEHGANGTLGKAVADVKAKTDTLPFGVRRGQAFANLHFVMMNSADHVTPATGLAVLAAHVQDNGSWVPLVGSVVEVGNGVYRISLTAEETNSDVITLRFTASGADARLLTVLTV